MESISSYALMLDSLTNRVFTHPNQNLFEGSYRFVRFNQTNPPSVVLENVKTGKREEVGETIFYAMRTPYKSDLEKIAQSQPKYTPTGFTSSPTQEDLRPSEDEINEAKRLMDPQTPSSKQRHYPTSKPNKTALALQDYLIRVNHIPPEKP